MSDDSVNGKTVLVTGGAGFIGAHTVTALLDSGWRVRVLDDLSTGCLSRLPKSGDGLELVVGSVCDKATVFEAMKGMQVCMHLAAQVSVTKSLDAPSDSATQNIIGTINILDAARHANLRRVVYASSAAVYGRSTKLPISEDTSAVPLSPYGLEKLTNEQYGQLFHNLFDLPSLGLRYFNVFGPGQDPQSQYSGVISKFVHAFCHNEPMSIFGNGLQTRDFIFVKDVARINVAALSADYTGVLNVATGCDISLLGLLKKLENVTGTSYDKQFYPPVEGDIEHSCGDISRMHRALGLIPEWSLLDGLRNLVEYSCGDRIGAVEAHRPIDL